MPDLRNCNACSAVWSLLEYSVSHDILAASLAALRRWLASAPDGHAPAVRILRQRNKSRGQRNGPATAASPVRRTPRLDDLLWLPFSETPKDCPWSGR